MLYVVLLFLLGEEIELGREAYLEKKITERVKQAGGLCLKWVSPGYTGVPDRIIVLPGGRIVFAEIKRPGRRDGRTPRQRRVADLLSALGAEVIVVDDMEDLDGFL